MKVLWCHSHLVWLVFEVPSLHALIFVNTCDLFLLLFCISKREERWEGRLMHEL